MPNIEFKVICTRAMPEFGFAVTKGLEKVEKSLVEVEANLLVGAEVPRLLEHNSNDGGGRRSVIRKEGVRKAERILQDPTLEPMEPMEGVIRKAPWVLLDPAEDPELKPCHHSTPLLPNILDISGSSIHQPFGREILDFSFQGSASTFLHVLV